MVKCVDSQRRRRELESCTCHNENTIAEEGNGKPSHKIHFRRKRILTLTFLPRSKSSMQRSQYYRKTKNDISVFQNQWGFEVVEELREVLHDRELFKFVGTKV